MSGAFAAAVDTVFAMASARTGRARHGRVADKKECMGIEPK